MQDQIDSFSQELRRELQTSIHVVDVAKGLVDGLPAVIVRFGRNASEYYVVGEWPSPLRLLWKRNVGAAKRTAANIAELGTAFSVNDVRWVAASIWRHHLSPDR